MMKNKIKLKASALALAIVFAGVMGATEVRAENGNAFYKNSASRSYDGGKTGAEKSANAIKGDESVIQIGAKWMLAEGFGAKIVSFDTNMFRMERQGGKEILVAIGSGQSDVHVRMPDGYEIDYPVRVMQPEGYIDGNGREVLPDAAEISRYPQKVLELVNQERAKAGARPLRMADDLCDAANVRARELAVLYSHTRPDGRMWVTAIDTKNRVCGENAAAGQATPENVMKSWMESPGHRKNILRSEYRELGVGYYASAQGGMGRYWIQIFRG